MGAPQSRLIQFVSAIKSGDAVTVNVTVFYMSNSKSYSKTIKYDEQEFYRIVKKGYGQMLVKVDEKQWPKSNRYLTVGARRGVGTEFPETEFEVTWKDKICKFRHSFEKYHLSAGVMPHPTYLYYIYEDGIHVGSKPLGMIFWKKDKRRIIEWEK